VARLTPLGHPTINLDGRYRTTSRPPTTGLRLLRTDLLRILYRSSSQAEITSEFSWAKADEQVEAAAKAATVPGSTPIQLCKNNADSAGNSYGCHENYLAGRHGEFGRLAYILTFDVGRSIAVR
jgi:hypothetical protein